MAAALHMARQVAKSVVEGVGHIVGRLTGRYYFEDYIRVYPDGVAFNRIGLRRRGGSEVQRNFLNHCKFYRFAGQFVAGQRVLDVGCGSGYGCALLAEQGAAEVHGCDISRHALRYATRRYGTVANFSRQGITDLRACPDGRFGVTICSEVLEHIKEYGLEDRALEELRRVTSPGGLVILGTPNSELLGDHGFSFAEIRALCARHFPRHVTFENALLPFGDRRRLWDARLAAGAVATVISERINLDETVLPAGVRAELKTGQDPGRQYYPELDQELDSALLHNTHSWVIVARNRD